MNNVVLFGGTGYVGSLILAELLRSTTCRIILPVRLRYDLSQLVEELVELCARLKGYLGPDCRGRILPLRLGESGSPIRLPAEMHPLRVERVINAAGSVNYFAEAELNEGNLAMTERTLEFTRWLGSPDYVYVSSAFSAGYSEGRIEESLHGEPAEDPTYYTRTKRLAERMVARSGLPYIIVRPSVLIGDSRTGAYPGKPYGLYQFLKSFTYFLTDCYHPTIHVVAPERPFHLLHQDTFAALFFHILSRLAPNRIINLVSAERDLPTSRDLYRYFFTHVTHPEKAFFYERIHGVPLQELPRRQRMFLHVTRVNAQIMEYPWSFARDTVSRLEIDCPEARPTTLGSTRRCVDAYVANSVKWRRYRCRYNSQFAPHSVFVDVPPEVPEAVRTSR